MYFWKEIMYGDMMEIEIICVFFHAEVNATENEVIMYM